MFRWIVFVALVLVFNVGMGLDFVWANNIVWDFVRTEINDNQSFRVDGDETYRVEAFVSLTGSAVQVSGLIHVNEGQEGQIENLGPLPEAIPNYPYMLFWVLMFGNFVLMGVAFVLWKADSGRRKETS